MREPIYVETGVRWSYAGAIEWPGWCRHARADADPVAELIAVGPRYQTTLARSGLHFDPSHGPADLEVVERLAGNSGTEWGVPSVVPAADRRALDEREVERLAAILQAAWRAFDEAVRVAEGHALRMGPRGGGRDLTGIVAHCREADSAYLSKLGARRPALEEDPRRTEAALRARMIETLRDRALGRPVRDASRTKETWLPRFFVRYVAWHALVHAWDIEDRRLD